MGDRSDPSHSMSFIIALKQSNLDTLEEKFWAVSNPDSPLYQQYMTKEEIIDLIKPNDIDYQIIIEWLKSNGINNNQWKSYGDAIEVRATAFQCETIFSTIIRQYKNNDSGKIIHRQFGSFSVPSHIKERIDAVFGLSTFPMPRYIAHKGSTNDTVGIIAQSIYNISSKQIPSKEASLTSQGVIEFGFQTFSPSDLSTYALLTGINIEPVPNNQIIGINDPTSGQTEATLDIDFIATVNSGASNWFWIEPGVNWLYAFAVHFFNTTVVPQVISISYGWYEGAQCDLFPDECSMIGVDSHGYVRRVNTEFQLL